MKQLRGRVAVITGGASGIGRGMADVFADEGMKLVIADVERPALDKAVAELDGAGASVVGVECDVSKPESVAALADRALEAFGAVHVVCNNAGVAGAGAGAPGERPLDEWDWVMGVNLMGVIHGVRSFVPIMLEQGDEGHVVNTASMAGLIPGSGIYGVTKHAVVALSESLFNELRQLDAKLGVSVLCPGWVNTRILESERNRPEAPREDPGELAAEIEMRRKVVVGLLERGLEPREVGAMVRDAIQAKRFYVLTHPWQNMVRNRMENILEDRDPVGTPPDGEDWSKLLTPDD
jgi:NAD(P)-dependent dehydrogenase (short-subunit alcohol dehydrogenase family)